jgi:NitT/TauT family transport system permease protein
MSVDLPVRPAPELTEAELTELTVARSAQEKKAGPGLAWKAWQSAWPKLLAVAIALALWQVVFLSGWKPAFVLPSPGSVLQELFERAFRPGLFPGTTLWEQLAKTMTRGVTGFALAIAIGTLLGVAVVQWRALRLAIGSLLAGLQTMPSIAWFPLAILFFGLTETAILFVVILGAAPSVAAGVITGIDEVPPPLLRAGKMIGANGLNRYRHIVLPAAMPAYLAGLKQGWAFSWRSLLAGELLVPIGGASALGSALSYSRSTGNAVWLLALMIVILIVGMVMDAIFGIFTRRIREKRGLTGAI